MIDYGKPIRIFYENLLQHGVVLSVEDGRLKVRGNTVNLSPAYREEIVKRSRLLIELLIGKSDVKSEQSGWTA